MPICPNCGYDQDNPPPPQNFAGHGNPRIWGYIRALTVHDEGAAVVERKRRRIMEHAGRLIAHGQGFFNQPEASIKTDNVHAMWQRYYARPGLIALNLLMQEGDILIVSTDMELDLRLDTLAKSVRWLTTRNRRVIMLDVDSHLVDTGHDSGRRFLSAMFRSVALRKARLTVHAKYESLLVIERGLWPRNALIPWGRRAIRRMGRYYLEWDRAQLDIVLEAVARYNGGESIGEIMADFRRRELTRPQTALSRRGMSWARALSRGRGALLVEYAHKMIRQTGWLGNLKVNRELADQNPEPSPMTWRAEE